MYIKKFERFKENCDTDTYEYQFRDIDEGIYYKRKVGEKLWKFTTEEDYNINEESIGYTQLIHVTTPKISIEIKKDGFTPKQFIDYKYYSDLGKDGIYFYDNMRQVQFYAGFFMSKAKIDKVALVYCDVPNSIIVKSDKLEDGFFVDSNDLNMVKIKDIKYKKYKEIY